MILMSIITCPHCGHAAVERMPANVCQIFYDCRGCGARLRPKSGDCCVFCSYGSVPCPPVQARRAGMPQWRRDASRRPGRLTNKTPAFSCATVGCPIRISSAMLVRDRRTSSANGAIISQARPSKFDFGFWVGCLFMDGKYTIDYAVLAGKGPGLNGYSRAKMIWPLRANSTGR